MNPVDPGGVADRLAVGGTAGLIAGLVFAVIGLFLAFQLGWVIQGWLYREVKAESKSWQTLAESLGEKVERLTTLQETQSARLISVETILNRHDTTMGRTALQVEQYGPKLDRLLTLTEDSPRRQTR